MNKVGFPGKKEINRLLNQMGGISNEERKFFLYLPLLYSAGYLENTINPIIPNFDDSMIAISSAIILFIYLPKQKSH